MDTSERKVLRKTKGHEQGSTGNQVIYLTTTALTTKPKGLGIVFLWPFDTSTLLPLQPYILHFSFLKA